MMKLAFYPAFDDAEVLTDHYYRLHWYLRPFHDRIEEILIPLCSSDLSVGTFRDYLDPALKSLIGSLPVRLATSESDAKLREEVQLADYIFSWSADANAPDALPSREGRTIRIDHLRQRNAGSHYLKFSEVFPDLQRQYHGLSQKAFARIGTRCAGKIGYVFGTGPSLAKASEHDFSDGVSIVCNSMVRNHALLDRLRPPLIVVADPIFHAGPSSYAAEFRKELVRALDRYDSDLIVPMRDYHVYQAFLPQKFNDRVAAVPFKAGDEPNLDLAKSLHVTSTSNVLTLLLIPVAATFFEEIRIFGCDGRPAEANSYFWNHDKESQFNEQMANIKAAHPAFFEINYDDYYQTHCHTLEKWLTGVEALGKLVTNCTPSYIPALQKRTVYRIATPAMESRSRAYDECVSIDPDGVNNFGHFLSYDCRIGEEVTRRGLRFRIMGRKDFELDPASLKFQFQKAFSVHSWAIGNRPDGPTQEDVKTFSLELREALGSLMTASAAGRKVLYVYCGSFEHAEVISEMLAGYDGIDANVNLFWTCFREYRSEEFTRRWRPVVQEILEGGRVTMTVPTAELQAGLLQTLGINFPLAPHPSPTLDDNAATKLVHESPCGSPKPLKVLFPGGVRPEKGFDLAVGAANKLADLPDIECLIRLRPGSGLPASMHKALRELDRARVRVSEEDLDDNGFAEFLAKGDIIALPYRAPQFAERTSGLLVDAILLGRPSVVVEGTWLAGVVEGGGVGRSAPATPEGLVEAIKFVARNYETIKAKVQTFRKDYLMRNSWAALVDVVTTPPARDQASIVSGLETTASAVKATDASYLATKPAIRTAPKSAGSTPMLPRLEKVVDIARRREERVVPVPGEVVELGSRIIERNRPRTVEEAAISGASSPKVLNFAERVSTLRATRLRDLAGTIGTSAAAAQVFGGLGVAAIAFAIGAPSAAMVAPLGLVVAIAGGGMLAALRESRRTQAEMRTAFGYSLSESERRLTMLQEAVATELAERLSGARQAIEGRLEIERKQRLAGQQGAEQALKAGFDDFGVRLDGARKSMTEAFEKRASGIEKAASDGLRKAEASEKLRRQEAAIALKKIEGRVTELWEVNGGERLSRLESLGERLDADLDRMRTMVASCLEEIEAAVRSRMSGIHEGHRDLLAGISELRKKLDLQETQFGSLKESFLQRAGELARANAAQAEKSDARYSELGAQFAALAEALGVQADELRNLDGRLQGVVDANRASAENLNVAQARYSDLAKHVQTKFAEQSCALREMQESYAGALGALEGRLAKAATDMVSANASRQQAAFEKWARDLQCLDDRVVGAAEVAANSQRASEEAIARVSDASYLRAILEPHPQQPFNRHLSADHVKTILTKWARPLSAPVNASSLAYMAHRIRHIEAMSIGRLATSIEDALLRCLVARAVKADHIDILEIGALFGIGSAILCDAVRGGNRSVHVTMIDPLRGYYDAAAVDPVTRVPIERATLLSNLSRADVSSDSFTLIDRLSTDKEAITQAAKREYDLIVIDGDHSFAGIGADFLHYAPLVKVGGYIVFDDYNKADWPDVSRFVDAEIPKHDWCSLVGSEWTTAVVRVISRPPAVTARHRPKSVRRT